MPSRPDEQFANARLAPLYDTFEGARPDLVPYLRLVEETGARTVLDVGCGTGSFALLAAAAGARVTAVDPAGASVDVARAKPGAGQVTWVVGEVDDAPPGPYDLAVMTGNVAQVFVEDDAWVDTLLAVARRLSADGLLCFETRRPEARAWESWAEPDASSATFDGIGPVRQHRTLLAVALPLVTFRWTYTFPDGSAIDSDSTLRFRTDAENRELLRAAGLAVVEVREAPDRPGLERVYLAARA